MTIRVLFNGFMAGMIISTIKLGRMMRVVRVACAGK